MVFGSFCSVFCIYSRKPVRSLEFYKTRIVPAIGSGVELHTPPLTLDIMDAPRDLPFSAASSSSPFDSHHDAQSSSSSNYLFGLPADPLTEVAVRDQEFSMDGAPKARSLAAVLPLPPPTRLTASQSAFQAAGGASMNLNGACMNQNLFSAPSASAPAPTVAPALPSFHRLSKHSSYRISASLRQAVQDMERSMSEVTPLQHQRTTKCEWSTHIINTSV